jgi:hypothetical protein
VPLFRIFVVMIKPTARLLIFLFAASALHASSHQVILPDRTEHLAKLTLELLEVDAKAFAKKIAEIDGAPPNAAREEERRLIVEFWAIADHTAALGYVENSHLRLRAKQALLDAFVRGWTRSAPEEAWAWSMRQPSRDQLDLPRAALETVATTEPDRGFAWLLSFATESPQRADLADHTFIFFFKICETGDYATVRRLIDQWPAGDLREQLLFSITERMARYTLEDTARWSMARSRQPDAYYPQAAVALEKVQHDFDEAFAWVLAIEAAEIRPKLVRTIAGAVTSREPTLESAKRILAKLQKESERQGAYAAFATTPDLVLLSPASILDDAWKISAQQDRRLSLVRGYSTWYAADKEAALHHLARASQGREEDRKIIERFLKQPDES